MKKIFSLIISLIFMTSCTIGSSYTINRNRERVHDVYSTKTEKTTEQTDSVDSYLDFIGEDEDKLTSEYGKPSLIDDLYGGSIYYYDTIKIAFGVDNRVINSILIYAGRISEKIELGMSLNEVLNNLNLKEDSVEIIDESNKVIETVYKSRECYIMFCDDILIEVLIK